MADLSSKGRKLIDAAMAHDDPPSTEESWGALVSRLTGEAPQGTLPISEPVRARSSRRWIWIAIVIAMALAVVVVLRMISGDGRERDVVAVDRADPPASKLPAKAPHTKTAPEKSEPEKVEPAPDELLVEAESALADGDPDRAMALLQRHAERAATDPSAPQRMALRVLALCAKGDREEARAEAKAFLAAHEQSPWSDRVRRSCAGENTK